jgi:hypothetical protein
MWYKVDFDKLGLLLLPTMLRKPVLYSFVRSMLSGVVSTYYQWQLFRNENLYKLRHTGQVCYLRKVLNDKLDPTLRRIIITDGQRFKRQYIYTRAENKPNYLGKMYLRPSSDYQDSGVDFNVFAPLSLVESSIYEMRALLDYYKAFGTRYKVNVF